MKNIPVVLISVLVIIFFSACKKETKCPAFDMNDLAEFPYRNTDTISFVNDSAELFQIFISQINYSLPYSYECRDLYNICPCINYAEAITTDTKTQVPYSYLRMEQSDVSEMQYFKYNVQGFEFEFDFRNELPYIDEMDQFKHYSSLTIGDVVYEDVVVVFNVNFGTPDISRVFFNKQNGVLQFIERSTNTVWRLKN